LSKIYGGTAQFADAGATTIVAPGPGKLFSFILSCGNAASSNVVFYDALSATNPIMYLKIMDVNSPWAFNFPSTRPLVFETGLTIVCVAGVRCTCVVEY